MSRKSKAAEFIGEEYSLSVTGRNVQVTDAMKSYVIEKLSKLEKYNLRILDVAITMDIQKLNQRIDIVLKVDHIIIKSHASTENIYASIDLAIDKLQRQLGRYHRRIREHQARGISAIDMNVNVLRPTEEEVLDINGAIEEANQESLLEAYKRHEIVNRETLPLKILKYDEAIMKMDLSNDAFMVFRAEEDMKIKVIYRRNDGNYGVIEPEA